MVHRLKISLTRNYFADPRCHHAPSPTTVSAPLLCVQRLMIHIFQYSYSSSMGINIRCEMTDESNVDALQFIMTLLFGCATGAFHIKHDASISNE